jgi:hypothetical protein
MTIQLIVVRSFGTYVKGEAINDPSLVAKILASEQAACVVRVQQGSQGQTQQGS